MNRRIRVFKTIGSLLGLCAECKKASYFASSSPATLRPSRRGIAHATLPRQLAAGQRKRFVNRFRLNARLGVRLLAFAGPRPLRIVPFFVSHTTLLSP